MLGRRLSPNDLELGSVPFGQQAMSALPKGHKPVDMAAKCPFQQGKKADDTKDPNVKKQKKTRGGCPLMPSEGKRNAPLGHLKDYYDTTLISIFSYMLDQRGMWALAFDTKKQLKKGPMKDRRKVFDTYPIYLKHTLFQDEENTKKMRLLEVAQRFFVYDKFREQGNKRMNKGLYEEAIRYYERALGCYKWLEVVEEPQSDSEDDKPQDQDTDKNIDQDDNDDTPLVQTEEEKLEAEGIKEEIKQFKQEQKDMKKHYKSLMKVYTDDNVVLHNPGVDLTDESDKELVQSMLFTLYLNMSVCYMHMSHFTLARQVQEDASVIMQNNSQLLFRMSQSIIYDNWSSYKQLLKAKEHIEKGIDMSNYEKIFQQEPGILMLMNLTNAKQVYNEHAHIVMERLKVKKQWIVERVGALFERANEISEIEKEMIEEGKIPFEEGVSNVVEELPSEQDEQGEKQEESKIQDDPIQILYKTCRPQLTEEHQEYEIAQEILRKYYRIIEFYTETKKDSQINLAKRELQKTMDTVYEMSFFMNLDFINYANDEILRELKVDYNIDLGNKKIIRRLARLCRDKVSDIFGSAHFNFEVMDYAMKDYFKRMNEEEKQRNQSNIQTIATPSKPWISAYFLSSEFALTMLLFVMVAGLGYYMNKNSSILLKVIGM